MALTETATNILVLENTLAVLPADVLYRLSGMIQSAATPVYDAMLM